MHHRQTYEPTMGKSNISCYFFLTLSTTVVLAVSLFFLLLRNVFVNKHCACSTSTVLKGYYGIVPYMVLHCSEV